LIGGWNFFCVSLGPIIFILKSIGGQIIFNSHWLLKDEEAIDWRGGFRSFHWARGTGSRKGHGGLPREKEVSWVGERKKEEKKCVKKKKKRISLYVWKGVVHETYVCKK